MDHLSKGFGDRLLIDDLSFSIPPGAIVGVIGGNGAGKSTLFRMLTGAEQPDSGEIRTGPTVDLAYVDQSRDSLDGERSVWEEIADGQENIQVGNYQTPSRAYVGRFNFRGADQQKRVRDLSGGERNRLLLAKLFSKPSNILVLDEPTNDLDIETLELLEELVMEYPGTVLVVSHDREFVNNVVTSTLVFEGDAQVNEYVGGYDDWLKQSKSKTETLAKTATAEKKPAARTDSVKADKPRKLSYKDQRELEALPGQIESFEDEIESLQNLMATDEFYKQDKEKIVEVQKQLEKSQAGLTHCYNRWEELEQ